MTNVSVVRFVRKTAPVECNFRRSEKPHTIDPENALNAENDAQVCRFGAVQVE